MYGDKKFAKLFQIFRYRICDPLAALGGGAGRAPSAHHLGAEWPGPRVGRTADRRVGPVAGHDRPQAGRHRLPSAPAHEGVRRREHERAHLVQVPLAEEPRRGAVIELEVEALEPGLGDPGVVLARDEQRHVEGQAQAGRDRIPGLALALRSLPHGPGLRDPGEVGHELRPQEVRELLHGHRELHPGRVLMGFEIRSCSAECLSHGPSLFGPRLDRPNPMAIASQDCRSTSLPSASCTTCAMAQFIASQDPYGKSRETEDDRYRDGRLLKPCSLPLEAIHLSDRLLSEPLLHGSSCGIAVGVLKRAKVGMSGRELAGNHGREIRVAQCCISSFGARPLPSQGNQIFRSPANWEPD